MILTLFARLTYVNVLHWIVRLYDNDNDNILFDHNIQIYTTDLQ